MTPKAPVISIVAPGSDYGKTRLITGVVAELSRIGIKACVVKHSCHASPPDSGKDTQLFRASGAAASALVDKAGMASVYLPGEGLAGAFNALAHLNPDIFICEGFKDSAFPKILMARSEGDLELAGKLKGVIAVASGMELASPRATALSLDAREVARFIAGWLLQNREVLP